MFCYEQSGALQVFSEGSTGVMRVRERRSVSTSSYGSSDGITRAGTPLGSGSDDNRAAAERTTESAATASLEMYRQRLLQELQLEQAAGSNAYSPASC